MVGTPHLCGRLSGGSLCRGGGVRCGATSGYRGGGIRCGATCGYRGGGVRCGATCGYRGGGVRYGATSGHRGGRLLVGTVGESGEPFGMNLGLHYRKRIRPVLGICGCIVNLGRENLPGIS